MFFMGIETMLHSFIFCEVKGKIAIGEVNLSTQGKERGRRNCGIGISISRAIEICYHLIFSKGQSLSSGCSTLGSVGTTDGPYSRYYLKMVAVTMLTAGVGSL
jgi:hypothetical protein